MIRNIQIAAVLNGFIVTCGCQTLVFNSSADLTVALKAYLDDPNTVEKQMLTEGINAKHTAPQEITAAPRNQIGEGMPRGVAGAGMLGGNSALAERVRAMTESQRDPVDSAVRNAREGQEIQRDVMANVGVPRDIAYPECAGDPCVGQQLSDGPR